MEDSKTTNEISHDIELISGNQADIPNSQATSRDDIDFDEDHYTHFRIGENVVDIGEWADDCCRRIIGSASMAIGGFLYCVEQLGVNVPDRVSALEEELERMARGEEIWL